MARGRKVNSNGERSKQLLLEKAIELFSKHGYHETKISDIVKAASLTQPTFYLYFQSKDKLFNDLNEEFTNNLIHIFDEKVENIKSANRNVFETLQNSIENAFNYFYENPNLTKIGFYEAPSANAVKDQIAHILVEYLKEEKDSLNINSSIELDTVAHSIIGSIERLTLKFILTKQSSPSQLANDIMKLYFTKQLEVVHS